METGMVHKYGGNYNSMPHDPIQYWQGFSPIINFPTPFGHLLNIGQSMLSMLGILNNLTNFLESSLDNDCVYVTYSTSLMPQKLGTFQTYIDTIQGTRQGIKIHGLSSHKLSLGKFKRLFAIVITIRKPKPHLRLALRFLVETYSMHGVHLKMYISS